MPYIPTGEGPDTVLALLESQAVRERFTREHVSKALELIFTIEATQNTRLMDLAKAMRQGYANALALADLGN